MNPAYAILQLSTGDIVFVVVVVLLLLFVVSVVNFFWRMIRHNEQPEAGGSMGRQFSDIFKKERK